MGTLSLLSRGHGQVLSPNQRLEVRFEPEDYFNWKTREGLHYVRDWPVAEPVPWWRSPHKTFSTRKGALVLYAEDLALPSWKTAGGRKARHGRGFRRNRLAIGLHTLRDLAGAILSYGSKQRYPNDPRWRPYLHFLSEQENKVDRQMHPGYSAKRYISCLAQTWDPSTVYRLQCAGCLRDPSLLQTQQTNGAALSKRQQDLSAAPTQYHHLPLMTSLHDPNWTAPRQRSNSGQCSPVLEEHEYDNDTVNEWEERGRKWRVPAPTVASRSRVSSYMATQQERESALADQVTATENQQRGAPWEREDLEPMDSTGRTGVQAFGSVSLDTTPVPCGRGHTTYYGGPFAGRKKSHHVKPVQAKPLDEREDYAIQEPLSDGGFLPPIHPTLGTDHGGMKEMSTKQVQEMLKLPPIHEENLRVHPQRKIRNGAGKPPKELLVLPLLVQFQTQANEDARDDEDAAHESTKSEFTNSDHPGPHLTDPETRVTHLQMDIDWNTENNTGVQPAIPALGHLPPIAGMKGPGNQSSMANLKTSSNNSSKNSSNNNSNSNTSRGLPTGTIRGTLPKELREFCKGSSVGSLIMGPDGEIICLSLLGSSQDTDIPVQLDFISDEACLSLVSEATQEEEWPGIQLSQQQEGGGIQLPSSIKIPTGDADSASYSTQEDVQMQSVSSDRTANALADSPRRTLNKMHSGPEGSGKSPFSTAETSDKTLKHERQSEVAIFTSIQEPKASEEQATGAEDANSDVYHENTEDAGPALHDATPPGAGPLHGPGSSAEMKQQELQAVKGSGGPKSDDSDTTTGNEQERKPDTEATFSSPEDPVSATSETEIVDTDLSHSLTVPSTSTPLQDTGGSTTPKPRLSGGSRASQAEKQPVTTEEEEMRVTETMSEQSTNLTITEKGPATSKGKMKPKNEKIAKPPVVPKEVKKKKIGAEKTKGKAVFVVGKPKEKKSEEKAEPTSKMDSTKEVIEEYKMDVPLEEDIDEPSSATEPEIFISPASRSSTPSRAPSEEPPTSEHMLSSSEEVQIVHDEITEEVFPESKVFLKALDTSTHPSIAVSLMSEDNTGSEVSEAHQGTARQDKSSRDRLRAEQAEKRRLEVERKRREREEQKRAEQEQLEREQRMKEELEREQHRRAEEIRTRKQQQEEERRCQQQEALQRAEQEKQAQERMRLQQEEHRRKLLELQRRKQQEEKERAELEAQKKKEQELALAEEQQRLLTMAEEEREQYFRWKQEEEERVRREEEERRLRAEEHRRLALDEAQQQAQLYARERAALERKLNFQRELMKESIGLDQTQDITRPWVFSYFQLLEMLGLPPTVEEK